MRDQRLFPLPAVLPGLLLALSLAACASNRPTRTLPDGARVITADQIERSGAVNALDAIRRAGAHFTAQQTNRGEVTGLVRRGRSSLMVGPTPLIYVDGARTSGLDALAEIPAVAISRIQIYSGVEGTRFFGTGGGNGVIVVHTHVGL